MHRSQAGPACVRRICAARRFPLRPTGRQVFLLLGVHEQGDAGHDANSMRSSFQNLARPTARAVPDTGSRSKIRMRRQLREKRWMIGAGKRSIRLYLSNYCSAMSNVATKLLAPLPTRAYASSSPAEKHANKIRASVAERDEIALPPVTARSAPC